MPNMQHFDWNSQDKAFDVVAATLPRNVIITSILVQDEADTPGAHRIIVEFRDPRAELLKVTGPCSNDKVGPHFAHSGPCDGRRNLDAAQ